LRKKLILALALVIALSLAAGIAYAATLTYGSVNVATADTYASTGDTISGWDWLRDSAYTADSTFTFNGIPRTTSDGKIYLRLAFLVTNKASGGSGYSTNVRISFPGSRAQNKVVRLENLTPIQDASDTGGYGYLANGTTFIRANKVPSSGILQVKITRIRGQRKHVATKLGDGSSEGLMLLWH